MGTVLLLQTTAQGRTREVRGLQRLHRAWPEETRGKASAPLVMEKPGQVGVEEWAAPEIKLEPGRNLG